MCFYLTAVNICVPYVKKETWSFMITVNGSFVTKTAKPNGFVFHGTNAIIPGVESFIECFRIFWFRSSITRKRSSVMPSMTGSIRNGSMTRRLRLRSEGGSVGFLPTRRILTGSWSLLDTGNWTFQKNCWNPAFHCWKNWWLPFPMAGFEPFFASFLIPVDG